jgi:macrolide-specific efflux system membrane fusion protein
VTSAENGYTNAVNSQTSNLLKDRQSITNAERSLASARASSSATVAGNNVKRDPATPDTLASDASTVAQAEQQVATAQKNLDDTELLAPVDGTVAVIGVAVGDEVSQAGASAAFTLTDLEDLRIRVGFSESDAVKVRSGQAATLTMDASEGTAFSGKVVSVDTKQTIVANVVTYYATISLVGDTSTIRPGMSATVDVTVDKQSNVLSLPTAAITVTGSSATVLVAGASAGDAATPKSIEIGLEGDERIEIVAGLAEGDTVVIESQTTGGLPAGFTPPNIGGGIGGGLGG